MAEIIQLDNNVLITNGKGEYREKSSTFTSFSFGINSYNEVKSKLKELKEKYLDASHICYAYRLLSGNVINEFATDAGEPKGSSGIPILNNLKRHELINSAVFVVRYFGGTKLGIPGLIHAYGESALNCLNNSQIGPLIKKDNFQIKSNYESLGIVEKIIKQFDGIILNKDYSDEINITLEIKRISSSNFENHFTELKYVEITKEN